VNPDDYLESMLAAAVFYRPGLADAERGNVERARQELERAAVYGERIAVMQFLLGEAWRDLGDDEEAKRAFERAIELEPDDGSALYALATLHTGAAALPYLQRLVDSGAEDPTVLLLHGAALARAGQLERARDSAVRAAELRPDLQAAQELLAAIGEGLRIGGAEGAAVTRDRIAALQAEWTAELARVQLAEGHYERAGTTFRRALALDPSNPDLARALGYSLLQARRFDDAANAFRRLLVIEPGSAEGRNALAYVYSITGDSLGVAARMAREAAERSATIRPYALDTLGWIRYRGGDPESALATLEQAADLLPATDASSRAENAFHRAAVAESLGREREARVLAAEAAASVDRQFWLADLRALQDRLGKDPQ
jgi:Flp pilus assembly protein TadD